jgi:hypothetical protein
MRVWISILLRSRVKVLDELSKVYMLILGYAVPPALVLSGFCMGWLGK